MLPSMLTVLAATLAVVVALAGAVVLLWRAKSPLILRPIIGMSRRVMNPKQLRTAGTPGAYAGIVRHRGRTTGRAYETPVGIIPDADGGGFLIALPYGSHASWLRNVLAAGAAELVTEGETVAVDRPELVPMVDVAHHFSATDQRLFRILAVGDCLRLRRVAQPSGASSSPGSAKAVPPRDVPAAAIASR